MDDPDNRILGWSSALRLGSHYFTAALLLIFLALVLVFFALPPLYYLLGRGWFAPAFVFVLGLFLLVVLRVSLLHRVYRTAFDDEDTAMLEYLVQQAAPGEEEIEMELIENALHLKQVRAKDCMTPRPEIVFVDVDRPVEELRGLFEESKLSRILVVRQDLSRVLGYVHVQQLFSLPASIAIMVMPISLVPVSIPVNDLLYRFIKNRTSIACVVDEFGSVVGLITMEDVLEQLFGEIDDEHDLDVLVEEQVGEGEFLFSGRLSIHELNMRYAWLKLPDRGFNTLSGLLIDELKRIPKAGHRFRLGGNTFIIEEVSDRKIDILRVFAG